MYCPYCNAEAQRTIGWYFDCDNDHTFHIDDVKGIVEQQRNGVPTE
jgi:hypothetical protein